MRYINTGIFIGCALILVYSCVDDDAPPVVADELKINLRWIRSYPGETRENIVTGVTWYLSFLGATLPEGSMEQAFTWTSDQHFTLDVSKVGFSAPAEEAFQKLIRFFKKSEEYNRYNAVDLGRLVVSTLNSSYHYYAITNAEPTLAEVRNAYSFSGEAFAVVSSTVAYGQRLIEMPGAGTPDDLAFIASEGEGRIDEGSFVAHEYETMIAMPNGQLRVALYNANGYLKGAASPELTQAGKPAKCLWCHESSFQPLHVLNEPVEGYLSPEEFVARVIEFNSVMRAYRQTLVSDIDFSKGSEHTLMELLYIGFMEPSAYRLAQEWSLSEEEVKNRLTGLPLHEHAEFGFFGNELFNRKDVEPFATYETTAVPDDAREASFTEPNWLTEYM